MAPRATLRALGFPEPGADALAMARIAGTRDVVLGLWQARSVGDRRASSRATASVAACDAGDTLAFAALLRGGQRRPGLRGLAAALPATLIGAALAARLRRADP